MENPPPTFHPGRFDSMNAPRRARIIPAITSTPRSPPPPRPPQPRQTPAPHRRLVFFFSAKTPFVFPKKACPPLCILPSRRLQNLPYSYPLTSAISLRDYYATLHLLQSRTRTVEEYKFTQHFLKTINSDFRPSAFYMPDSLIKDMTVVLQESQQKRQALKAFLTRWILKRRIRCINDMDIVTCETPKHPVYITQWPSRSQYVFEARTLHRDIVERLLHHSDLWIHPLPPRNPFTNVNLSIGQLHHSISKCRSYGVTHWVTEAFHACQYNLATLQRNYAVALKLSALKRMFQGRRLSSESKDFLLDFIEQEHDHFGFPFREHIYTWALNTVPDNRIIQEWIRACKLFYEIHITVQVQSEAEIKQITMVNPITKGLCSSHETLAAAKNLWHKQRLLTAKRGARGGEAAVAPEGIAENDS